MSDVLILGAGIIGLLCAREFSAAGARVTVLERQHLGRESSWAGGGILSPLYPWRQDPAITALARWSQARYPDLAEELKQNTGIDPEWSRSGLLVADLADTEIAQPWCNQQQIMASQPANDWFETMAPSLSIPHGPSLWLPEIAQIRNPRLLKALHKDLEQRAVRIMEYHEATELVRKGRIIQCVRTSQGDFAADSVIATAGAWSTQLLRSIEPTPRIVPVKGQMLLYRGEPGMLKLMILKDGHYLIPRQDGRILVGSTVDHSGFDKNTDAAARATLEAFAYATLPALRQVPLERHWAGLRPGTQTGIPYIDRHPEIDNLAINCGHFRNGLVMGPASARLLVDLILKRNPILPPSPYRLDAPH